MTPTLPKRPRGRPPLEATGRDADGRSPEVHVSLARSDLLRVQALAAYRDTSVGAVIRGAVVEYLRARAIVTTTTSTTPAPAPPTRVLATSTTTARLSRRVVREGV